MPGFAGWAHFQYSSLLNIYFGLHISHIFNGSVLEASHSFLLFALASYVSLHLSQSLAVKHAVPFLSFGALTCPKVYDSVKVYFVIHYIVLHII